MFINKKLSISNIFFFHMLLISTLSCLTIGFAWITHEKQDFNKQAGKLKSEYLDAQKLEVKNAVEHAVGYIQYKKALTEKRLRQKIKKRVYEAHDTASHIYRENTGKMSDEQIKLLIKQALRTVRFFDNRNYYFIDDLNGNSILFPPNPKFENQNLLYLVNKGGVRPLPAILELLKKSPEGYYVYNWIKYTEGLVPSDKEFPKITYFKFFEPYNWFIAVGEYLDFIEDDIKIEILERVSEIRLKNGEYLEVHTSAGAKLISGSRVLKTPVQELHKTDSRGVEFIRSQIETGKKKEGGFVFYDMADTDQTIRPRISFARHIPEQEWIVTAGAYIDEADIKILQEKFILQKDERRNLMRIVVIMSGIWIFAFILARYIAFKSKSSFKTFSHFFKIASTQSAHIDKESLHFSEFSELAGSANQMIDDRHKAEAMLKKSRARFRQLAENIREVFWIVSPDWKEVIYISPAYEEVWGRSCESLYENPSSWLKVILPEDAEKVNAYLEQKSAGDLTEIIFPEYRIQRPDGGLRWILARGFPVRDESGQVYRVTGIAEDITEKKQSDEAMHTIIESSAGITGTGFFDKIAELISAWLKCEIVFIGEIESRDRISIISMVRDDVLSHDFTYDISGTPCEVVRENGFSFYPENVAALFPNDKFLSRFKVSGYVGTRITNHKGYMIGILCILSRERISLPDRAREVLDIIAARISAEIERRRYEKERDEIEAKLRQSHKMESVGTMAGGIAHDFNNILGIIIGNLELVMDDVPLGNPIASNLEEIRTASMRAKNIVKQLLNFSHKSEVSRHPVKLAPLIEEAANLLRATIPTTIEIRLDLTASLPAIAADPTQVHQIIINLCTNAAHAMEEKGGILTLGLTEVQLENSRYDGYQKISPGRYLRMMIRDTGRGISPDTLKKVFDPYFTTKAVGKGTGMGLSVVHGIVKNHDGAITIQSRSGKGTVVEVLFPVIDNRLVVETNSKPTN